MIEISNKLIGPGQSVFIVAEACDNHLGSVSTAKEMIRCASLAGCDAIKFQHHLADEEMLSDVPMSDNFDEPLYHFLKKYALTIEEHEILKSYCELVGIQYLCTPFSYRAAEELNEINVNAFKVGSGEMTDLPFLEKLASSFSFPMIVSTGMSTFEEIDETYNLITEKNVPLALLNCVSEYPPRYEDINLGVIEMMRDRYPLAVIGHSDHTPDIYTSFAAVAFGACIIEKHVILDKRQPGPDQSVSIDFRDLSHLVDGIRKIEAALGCKKIVHKREEKIRIWAHRSLVTTRALISGERITVDSIWSKRPGTGIPSRHMSEVVGRIVNRNVPENCLLQWDDFEDE